MSHCHNCFINILSCLCISFPVLLHLFVVSSSSIFTNSVQFGGGNVYQCKLLCLERKALKSCNLLNELNQSIEDCIEQQSKSVSTCVTVTQNVSGTHVKFLLPRPSAHAHDELADGVQGNLLPDMNQGISVLLDQLVDSYQSHDACRRVKRRVSTVAPTQNVTEAGPLNHDFSISQLKKNKDMAAYQRYLQSICSTTVC